MRNLCKVDNPIFLNVAAPLGVRKKTVSEIDFFLLFSLKLCDTLRFCRCSPYSGGLLPLSVRHKLQQPRDKSQPRNVTLQRPSSPRPHLTDRHQRISNAESSSFSSDTMTSWDQSVCVAELHGRRQGKLEKGCVIILHSRC